MRGNSHVRFGAGDEETRLGNGARRFIPTLPANPAQLSLSGRCGVSPQKGSDETAVGSSAGEGLPLLARLQLPIQEVVGFVADERDSPRPLRNRMYAWLSSSQAE